MNNREQKLALLEEKAKGIQEEADDNEDREEKEEMVDQVIDDLKVKSDQNRSSDVDFD